MSRVLHLLPVWFALFIITGLGGDRSGSKTPLNSRSFYSKLLLNKYLTKSVVRTTKILKGELITFYLHPFEKAIPDWVAFFSLSLLPSFLLLLFFFLEGDKCSTLWVQHNRTRLCCWRERSDVIFEELPISFTACHWASHFTSTPSGASYVK